jgi:undecaprenyl phosphate-alpha-L-ara4N flippase subunit ArnE
LLQLILSVLLNALAQILLKKAATSSSGILDIMANLWFYFAMSSYVISIIFWVMALRITPLSVAYPMQAAGFILVSLTASLIFNESFTAPKLLALSLIAGGVALMATSSKIG